VPGKRERERERERESCNFVSNPHIVTNKKELQKNTVTSTPPLQLTVANTKQQLKDAKKKYSSSSWPNETQDSKRCV
jgi:hypothetical protein